MSLETRKTAGFVPQPPTPVGGGIVGDAPAVCSELISPVRVLTAISLAVLELQAAGRISRHYECARYFWSCTSRHSPERVEKPRYERFPRRLNGDNFPLRGVDHSERWDRTVYD